MKNKLITVLLVLCLSVSLMACGNTKTNGENPENPTDAVNQEANQVASNLEGLDLVKTISNERPEKMRVVSEMKACDMNMTITTYYDGDQSRTEVDLPDMAKTILIQLPDEAVMYRYEYGAATGVKMTGATTSYLEEMGLMRDSSMLAEITDASSEDVIARVETLDGEEVIYIEATESDEKKGDALFKMWYSQKYATPLKYEVIVDETVMVNLTVTEITDNVNINADLFTPPSDVSFQEVDMQSMMADW